ncbi:hypothetical protein KKG45_10535 [bacterium]|nr:hypothetical protein [bacterium]MBU1073673.1 hypothetical protein [bacterium]MBU1675883.1 hypothetical protein [bacterium]
MRFIPSLLVAAMLILSWSATSPAAPLPFAVPKDEPAPARPAFRAPRGEIPPCGGAPTLVVTLATDETQSGDTTGGASAVAGYACVAWQETGPEAVYLLDVQQDVNLHVRLDAEVDLDLFLLTDCDSDSCAAWHSSEFVVNLPSRAEPYVLIVDGYLGAEGPFAVDLHGYASGPPPGVCGDAVAVVCGEEPVGLDGNLFAQPNQLLADACATYLERGGEQWYAVSLSDSAEVTAGISEHFFDAAIWLFDGCEPGSQCVAFADGAGVEGAEELIHRNLTGAGQTYYLAVDAFHEVQSEGAGAYLLTFSCTDQIVPAETSSFGDLKAMFR